MSLVNEMLRDLDQRRQDGSGSGGRVRLTPASEFPKAVRHLNPLYVLIGLLIAVIGLGFVWLQMSGSAESRPVDVRPAFTPTPEVAQASDQEVFAETDTSSNVRPPSQSGLAAQRASIEPANILSQAVQQNQRNIQQTTQAPAAAIVDNPAINLSSGRSQEPASLISTNIDLTSGSGIDESVTVDAKVSEEEQDTLAVQESLRLIANNQLQDAYANLDGHIQTNRYAHQSRETYAKLLMSAGELKPAYALIEEGLVLAPNHSGFKKVKARLLIQNSQVLDAVALLLTRAPQIADDIEYHEILASAQLATRDYSGAAISYSGLVGVDQDQGKFWYGYAASQELLGNIDIARQAYSRAVQQSSLSASLRQRSRDRLLALGQ